MSDNIGEAAGRKLDALVAERVMGLVPCTGDCHANGDMRPCHAQPDSPDQGAETRQYSTDIADAWLVVEAMAGRGYWARLTSPFTRGSAYFAGFTPHDFTGWNGRPDHLGGGDTMPLAICRAALAAVGAA